MERIVLHLDLDYFFAQVEERDHPEYEGKPIVVCVFSGRDETSGVVSTSNYEARKYGVRSGIPIKLALEKLKGSGAVFVPVNHARYGEMSQRVMESVAAHGEKFEYSSIDEAFLEITQASHGDYEKAEEIANTVRTEVLVKTALTCSVGVGPNKLISKIASDFRKPNGLTVVRPDEVDSFLSEMDVGNIPGIGKKGKEILESMGIRTISQLRKADPTMLAENFGKKTGRWLYLAARGIDESEVGADGEQKQISRIMTLKQDSRDPEYIMRAMEELILDIGNELAEQNIAFASIGASVIDENMKTFSKSRTLPHPSSDISEIRKVARALFSEIISETKTNFRRAGVKVEKLESKKGQKTLGEF